MAKFRVHPGKELLDIEREFTKVFNALGSRMGLVDKKDINEDFENAVYMPLADIYEADTVYKIKLDLPGVQKENIKIQFKDGELNVAGERKQETEDETCKHHRVERTYGKFYRSFTLPKVIEPEGIKAEFRLGQLIIVIPKVEEEPPQEIKIDINE